MKISLQQSLVMFIGKILLVCNMEIQGEANLNNLLSEKQLRVINKMMQGKEVYQFPDSLNNW